MHANCAVPQRVLRTTAAVQVLVLVMGSVLVLVMGSVLVLVMGSVLGSALESVLGSVLARAEWECLYSKRILQRQM